MIVECFVLLEDIMGGRRSGEDLNDHSGGRSWGRSGWGNTIFGGDTEEDYGREEDYGGEWDVEFQHDPDEISMILLMQVKWLKTVLILSMMRKIRSMKIFWDWRRNWVNLWDINSGLLIEFNTVG